MDKLIVTGSGGMLGRALLDAMKSEGTWKVYAVTSQVEELRQAYKDDENIEVVPSIEAVADGRNSLCIHCAFPRTQNGETLSEAILATESVIEALHRVGCIHLTHVSSQSVYSSNTERIWGEKDAVSPNNLYGMAKFSIEQMVRLLCDRNGMEHLNIRLGSLASAAFDQRMINRFYAKILSGEEILVENHRSRISYLHIKDAASAFMKIVQVISSGKSVENLYNLGNPDWMTIYDVAEACSEKGQELKIGSAKIHVLNKDSFYSNVMDSTAFCESFDWKPAFPMESIIEDVFMKKSKGGE